MTISQVKVVVIGAGISGLTTAYRLQQKKINVHVYEARGRVGGRIFTAKLNEEYVELGGQNIKDGGNAENICRLMDEFSLKQTKRRISLDYQYFNGSALIAKDLLYNKKFVPKDLQSQLTHAAEKSTNMKEVLRELYSENDPLYKVLSVRLAAYEGAPVEKLSALYTDTLYHMILGGLSSVHQSANLEENYVDMVSIQGGNALLPEKLAESLHERIHLNMPLIAISKTAAPFYELTFVNGEKVKADILVLAIPCSVYRDIHFENNFIPEERLEAIANVQYGTNAKILVPVPEEPLQKPTLINDRMGSFFANHNILTLFYTGDSGKFSEKTLKNTYQQEYPMLQKGLGKLCPPYVTAEYARDESFVSYLGPVGYSWPNDPYAKGSYSCISPGQETLLTATQNENAESVKTLFAPVDQTLYFSGEHTSILKEVPGTMEAACESGERIARLILQSCLDR